MSKFDKTSIKWKLFAYLLIFIAIPIALLWLFQIAFQESFYTAIKTNDIKNSIQTVEENIDNDELDVLIDRIARQEGVNIQVYTQEGTPLHSSDFGPAARPEFIDKQGLRRYYELAEQHGGTYVEQFEPQIPFEFSDELFVGNVPPRETRMGKNILYTVVTSSGGENVMIMLSATITPVTATVRTLQVQLVFITIIMLVLCLILAFVISKRISKPIAQTTEAAKELAKGEYDTDFNAHGYREINELNETLSYAASELSKVDGLRQELIANVSHDLRTPLTMIAGYAEVMRDIPGENTPENIQTIIDETNRLSGLVNDVMDLSRIQSGGGALERSKFNLTKCIESIMGRYAKLTQQDGYTIRFIDGEDAYVYADEVRISQVVYNLINNAINYAGKDKTVTVCQTVQDGKVRIEVIDTGDGIRKEDIPYIWDRYYRVDKTHKRATIGTGLGLSIVRAVLKKHDAAYGVISREGDGSMFWFELDTVQSPKDNPK